MGVVLPNPTCLVHHPAGPQTWVRRSSCIPCRGWWKTLWWLWCHKTTVSHIAAAAINPLVECMQKGRDALWTVLFNPWSRVENCDQGFANVTENSNLATKLFTLVTSGWLSLTHRSRFSGRYTLCLGGAQSVATTKMAARRLGPTDTVYLYFL